MTIDSAPGTGTRLSVTFKWSHVDRPVIGSMADTLLTLIAGLADLYAACYNTDEVREAAGDLAPAGIPVATEAGPLALAWLGSSLFVANSLNNTVDELRFDPPAVRKQPPITIPTSVACGPDLEFVAGNPADGLIYVSNAAAGLLDVIDPVAGLVIDEVPLGRAGARARLHPGRCGRPHGARSRAARVPAAAHGTRAVERRGLAPVCARDVSDASGRSAGAGVRP